MQSSYVISSNLLRNCESWWLSYNFAYSGSRERVSRLCPTVFVILWTPRLLLPVDILELYVSPTWQCICYHGLSILRFKTKVFDFRACAKTMEMAWFLFSRRWWPNIKNCPKKYSFQNTYNQPSLTICYCPYASPARLWNLELCILVYMNVVTACSQVTPDLDQMSRS